MRNPGSNLFLSSMSAALVVTFAASVSRAQSVSTKVTSAVSDTATKTENAASEAADKTRDLMKGATTGTTADVLSRIHEVNETEIYVGKLAEKKGSTPEVRSYGKELVKDHRKADRKIQALAKAENLQLAPPAPISVELGRIRNHDGAEQEMLANVSGNTFDRDMLEAMVEDHQKNIDALKEIQKTSDDQKLRDLIQELIPQLTDHQEMAEKLLVKAKKAAS
jgi:putative membrane protein